MFNLVFQSDLYVESRNGKLVSAVIPPTFQSCTREGIRPGCLFKFDLPYEQCSQNRTGIIMLLYCLSRYYPGCVHILSFYSIPLINTGFLCGRCPEGKGVDLTLRQCKECTVGDAIGVAIVCEFDYITIIIILL